MIGERLREDIFESFEDEFDINDKTTWAALVIPTSIEAGIEYAKILGIKNYIVTNKMDKIQGLRIRAIVPTPGYLADVERAAWEAQAAYGAAIQSFSLSAITRG